MEQVKITKIYRSFKDKEGNPLKTKDGRNYERVAIKCEEYEDRWISGFGEERNKNWEIGDVVEIEIYESDKKDKDGNPYLNFRMPSNRVSRSEFDALESRVSNLEAHILKK